MLSVSPITNVNNTPNKNLSFKSGLQTNFLLSAPAPSKNVVEGGLVTGFLGTLGTDIKEIHLRAKNIENGLSKQVLNYFA